MDTGSEGRGIGERRQDGGMDIADVLVDAFDRVRGTVLGAVDGLTEEQLGARLDPEANSIAWLMWSSCTRVRCQISQAIELASGSSRACRTTTSATSPGSSRPTPRRAGRSGSGSPSTTPRS